MRVRSFAIMVAYIIASWSPALASSSITNKASGSAFTMDFALDSVTGNIRQMMILVDPTTGLLVPPFQAGNSIGNAAFGISGTLPAFASTPAFTISGTLPAFAATPTVNLGTLGGAALESGGNLATLAGAITASVQQTNEKQINGIAPLMGNGVSGTGSQRVNIASDNTPFSVNLGTIGTAATAANQTNASQKTQLVDSSGNVIASTSNNLDVQCANCSGSGVSTADEASFTGGASLFAGMGGFFQTTPTSNALTTGQQGMAQMTANRALFMNPRNAAGTEIATAANPYRTDPTGSTTQPVSAAALPLPTGASTSALQPTNAAQGSTTSGQTGHLMQGAVTTAAPAYTTGQTSPFSLDTAGNVRVNVVTGGGAGGTSSTFGAAFPGPGTAIGAKNGANMVNLVADGSGNLDVNVAAGSVTANAGTNLNTSLLALETGGNLATIAGTVTAGVQQDNTKQINGVAPLMGNGVSGTGSQRVNIASDNTAFSVNLGTIGGTATAANQTNATQKTQIVDGSGNVIASTSNNLDVQCANCSGSGVSTADEATFTGGTSLFAGGGGFFQTTPTSNALTTGQQGAFQVTANRALFSNPRNAAGTEIATLSNPFRVDPTGTTTQPVSAASLPLPTGAALETGGNLAAIAGAVSAGVDQNNTKQINGVVPLMGNGISGTGSQRVNIASDNTAFSVNANAGTNLNTSLLALETGGNLATLAGTVTAGVQQDNTKQINGVAPLMGNGVSGTGSQRVNIASDNTAFSVNSVQSGTWTVQPGNTANTTAWKVDGSAVTQPVSAASLPLPTGAATSANQETAAAQGSTTSGQTGPLMQGAVTTAAPSYTTGQTSPLSIDTNGNVRVVTAGATGDTVGTLGALGALNNTASVALNGQSGVGVFIAAGTLIGTVSPQISYDGGTTWIGTGFYDVPTQTLTGPLVFGSANPAISKSIIAEGGATNARVIVSGYTSGTANATLRATRAATDWSIVSQGSNTAAQVGTLIQGAVTTAAPTYTTAQTSPISLTTGGAVRVDASSTAIQGSAPGVAPASGNTVSVQFPSLDPCLTQAHAYTPINMATSIVKVIVTGTSAKKTYVCSLFLFSGGADNVGVFEATTGTTCATSPLAVIGGSTTVATAATGLDLVANQGFVLGSGQGAIAATTVANNDLCLATSAAVQLSGVIVTAQQ